MAKKIYAPSCKDALVTGIYQPHKKGTKIFAPNDSFGLVEQGFTKLKLFTDSVTLDKKSLPGLKMPKIPFFGKIKSLYVYFFPYGFSGTLNFNEVFTLKSGKKARMVFTLQYEVEIEEAMKAYNLLTKDYVCKYFPDASGSVISFAEWRKFLVEKITEMLIERESKNLSWKYEPNTGLGPNGRGVNYSSVSTHTQIEMLLGKLFKEIGYKEKSLKVKFGEINYI